MYQKDYTTGDEDDEFPDKRWDLPDVKGEPTPRPGEPGYKEYLEEMGVESPDFRSSVQKDVYDAFRMFTLLPPNKKDSITLKELSDLGEQLAKEIEYEILSGVITNKTNETNKMQKQNLNNTVLAKLDAIHIISSSFADNVYEGLIRYPDVTDFAVTFDKYGMSNFATVDIAFGGVSGKFGEFAVGGIDFLDWYQRKNIEKATDFTNRQVEQPRKVGGATMRLDWDGNPISRTKSNTVNAELEALRLAKDQTINKLKEEINSIRDKAQNAVTEANDAISQYEQSPAFIGVVLEVAPFSYDEEAFKPQTMVRLHKGIHAGSIGKVVSLVNNYSAKVEVLDRESNVLDTVIYQFRPKPNSALVETEADVWEPLFNHEYKAGMRVTVTVPKSDSVAYTTETKAEVVFPPTPSGDMDVKLDTDEVITVNVGTLGYLSPEGLQAGWAYVHARGEIIPCAIPKRTTIEVGASVICNQGGQIIDVVKGMPNYGNTYKFNKYVECTDRRLLELTNQEGQPVRVYSTITEELKTGDNILLDSSNSVALEKVVVEDTKLTFKESTNVSWDDIGGVEDAKQAFMEAIEYPVTHADIYASYGIKPPKGIMLYGSPGTGKTMIAKAAVTSLKNTYKSDADTAFIYVKGPEILSQWVGVAEQKIRDIFAQARAHKAAHGFPALVFIDEADAILGVRGSSRSSDVDKTIVPQFLAEMDGLEDSGCILVLATNRPDSLDPAVTRNGRIDRKVKVARPDYATSKIILGLYTKNVPFKKGLTNKAVVDYTTDLLFHETLVIKAVKMTTGIKMLNLGEVVNGAMLASIVDIAKSNALQRDLKVKKPTGVTLDDMKFAVKTIWQENLDVNYDNDLRDLIGTDYKNIVGEEKLTGVPEILA